MGVTRRKPPRVADSASTENSPAVKAGSVSDGGTISLAFRTFRALACDPAYFWVVGGVLLILETLLCVVIIRKVSYTNIDWDAYMQEVGGFLSGERNYAKLEGDTGPLVYPAGFVYIYSGLSYLTSGGKNVLLAQYIFAGVYVATLAIVMALYRRSAMVQRPYVLVFLSLSKRLHSIYVLRLFNDPIAMLPLYLCMLAMLERKWSLATVLYSLALSIKMNILLFAPGFALLMYQALGLRRSVQNAVVAVLIQAALAAPFLATYPQAYLGRSFDFGRVFFYKWTVNWRFMDEETFLSATSARLLLGAHTTLLIGFITKWCWNRGGILAVAGRGIGKRKAEVLHPDYILSVMFTCNLIGILCARSLHYQFWSWYAHSIPYLVWLPSTRATASAPSITFGGCLRLGGR
ncbi:dolichyl-P-Man:Man5GlcNAc2-PP-dolichol alpha-1,3-mannosyltransferase [Powellomyces hirtus]|uniref:Dol-P-Man:Man(5)GlcNAc(2)-PP-Dol alpha-1,3-mannosyltransferase n=1 Tax=Powellomyces hirtus TaxID=109895 RepID=A0A507EBF0_9FUNG|nr:dolichyl-P-Man:Man5GlcNAc2-PP-dolichol alpha-1,3-mannosyltransferase [Powellomyces hirtus]